MITGVILAGGFGTRLHPVLPNRPKVLAEVNRRPFITFLLEQMADAGIRRFLICTGHRGDVVRNVLGETYCGLPVRYSREPTPLGTGGALRHALQSDSSDLWLVLNGDSYIATGFRRFIAWHYARQSTASMILAWVDDSARFGTVDVAPDGHVQGFYEKQAIAAAGWINSGVYLLSRGRLESMPNHVPLSLEREVMPSWIDAGLWGYQVKAPFLDIGTPPSLAQADSFFTSTALDRSSKHAGPRGFVIIDRDGTLIVEKNYLNSPDQVELVPNAIAGLKKFRQCGLGVIMVTNQSGIGRGYFGKETVQKVHDRVSELLHREGAELDAIYICPHTSEEQCDCRKPQTGLVKRAAREFEFDPATAFFVGDKACDIDLGLAFKATTLLVRTGYGQEHLSSGQANPCFVVNDLAEASEVVAEILKDDLMQQIESTIANARMCRQDHVLASIKTNSV